MNTPPPRRQPAAALGVTISAPLSAAWARLDRRERRLTGLAAATVALALLWWLALAPALGTLRQARTERPQLEARWQHMQTLKAEADSLKALPGIRRSEAQRALQDSVVAALGASAQLSVTGDRANLVLKGAPAGALAQWLQDARVNARALPVQARLTRTPGHAPGASAAWDGTLTLALPAS
ncbi:type II secretion system protein M [Comamonadaceae bacterium OH2545_COT-014]|nr:type II secretion system protein M [Comamonadaceae bacterium OH2545_COT-014]